MDTVSAMCYLGRFARMEKRSDCSCVKIAARCWYLLLYKGIPLDSNGSGQQIVLQNTSV